MSIKKYPSLAKALQPEWQKLQENERIVLRDAAEKLGVSTASLNGWLLGTRAPKADKRAALAKLFFPDDKKKQEDFSKELKEACKDPEEVLEEPLRRWLAGGNIGNIPTVGKINYPPFDKFFERFFLNFMSYCGEGPIVPETADLSSKNVSHDVVLSLLATPDRAKTLAFFKLPIRIPLNAVVMSADLQKSSKETIARAIFPISRTQLPIEFIPIVNATEVGGLHAKNQLERPSNGDIQYVDYGIQHYARQLEATSNTSRTAQYTVPFVLADEITCCHIVKEIGADNAKLVVSPENNDVHRPRYFLSFAVKREFKDTIAYLADALEYFLMANPLIVATAYGALKQALQNEFESVIPGKNELNESIDSWLNGAEYMGNSKEVWNPICSGLFPK